MNDNSEALIRVHYWLEKNSHNMDAFVLNRCEYEYIKMMSEVARILEINIDILSAPNEIGGLVQWFKIIRKGENRTAAITAAVVAALISAIIATPAAKLSEKLIDKIFEDREYTDIQKHTARLELQKLIDDSISAAQTNTLKMRRSNFYQSLAKEVKVNEVSYTVFSDEKNPYGSEKHVKRSNFDDYILEDDVLEPEIIDGAVIDIVAPVLKKGKYKWLGIYEDRIIPFSMNSAEFKQSVQNGEIEFKNGSTITCELVISKKIDSEGDEIVTGYKVTTVYSYTENGIMRETTAGSNVRKKKAQSKLQISMFDVSSESD